MILSDRQAQLLLQILVDSLKLLDAAKVFNYTHEIRNNLYNDIINQQSRKLIDLKDKDI